MVADSHLVCLSCVTSAPNTTPATQGALVIIARITIPPSKFSQSSQQGDTKFSQPLERVLHKDLSINIGVKSSVAMFITKTHIEQNLKTTSQMRILKWTALDGMGISILRVG